VDSKQYAETMAKMIGVGRALRTINFKELKEQIVRFEEITASLTPEARAESKRHIDATRAYASSLETAVNDFCELESLIEKMPKASLERAKQAIATKP
jgi:hypothetical protein